MPKTDKDQNESPSDRTSQNRSKEGRMVTEEEHEALIEDAKAFKKEHDKTFRILSESGK